MGSQALRMNVNTLLRHDVFSVEQLSSTVSEAGTNFTSDKRLGQSFCNLLDCVADRIADESAIRRSKQFPYQYFATYLHADDFRSSSGGGTDCSLPLVAANPKHANRKFAGVVLISDNESWVGTVRPV
jgi:hypothetical protein